MSEVPPGARAIIGEVADHATAPVKVLVTGGIGTGKSTTLAAVRETLRAGGLAVFASPVAAQSRPAKSGVVVDDAHLLADDDLEALTRLVLDPESTVVVATEPSEHRVALRALMIAMERERPRVALGPWPRIEVSRHAEAHDPDVVSAIMAATAGLPFLVEGVLTSLGTATVADAAYFALVERLRRTEEPVLDAVLIASLSAGLGAADIAATLSVDIEAARGLVDRAYATGLLDPSLGVQFSEQLHRAAAQLLGAARHHEIEAALMVSQLESSTLSTDLAVKLTQHGVRDARLAAVLEAAAGRGEHAGDAVSLYRAAVDAGSTALAPRLADALALRGDCAGAAALADSMLGSDDKVMRANAVRIAASVAMHDGNAGHAADLFTWLGPDPDVSAAAAVVLTATGDAAAARAALTSPDSGPPTSATRAARSLADGLLSTLDQPYASSIARLGQAVSGPPAAQAVPDSGPAVVALAALHAGDPVRARSVIGRAVRAPGTDVMFGHRHRLLQAWIKMQDGQLQAAAADVAAVPEHGLHRRDALWWAAVQTGLARRNGDTGALQQHWHQAMDVLAEYSMELFCLLPLGELWVAAARMRQEDRLVHTLAGAFDLLARLGEPVAWSLPLHWAGVHAAILTNSPEAMAPHGQALSAAATDSGFARALAGAGRAWLRVLANQVDVDGVAAAARGLAQFGLTWDATRLAGQAALQTPDPRISSAMLQVARDLKLAAGQDVPDEPDDEPAAAAAHPRPMAGLGNRATSGALSEREREVAELLLLGMPYRDIGAQLFISAKTVEHHVARIRRRLGAESRSEMLSMLRAMLAPQT